MESLSYARASRPGGRRDIPSSAKSADRKYKFNRRVNRLSYQHEISELFDSPRDVKQAKGRYYGKIRGVESRIDFSNEESCLLSAATEEGLSTAYQQVINILLGRN